ncbi:MAG TPA: hypothetical protein VEJ00_06630 [Candidatus Acidoferrales bacterium]|jgi:ribosomal protein L37AE/L43A|nr:hypothetical protein [Candidatus Acidoferrales bacterium]
MKSNRRDGDDEIVRMELKYCEHCGGLWLRECGAGVVYCENCQPRIADLPIPKKKPARVSLPVQRRSLVGNLPFKVDDTDDLDFEAAGGAA